MQPNFQRTMKPEPKDLTHLLTAESRNRKLPNLKDLYQYMNRPGLLSLAGGMPNPAVFPFDAVGTKTLASPFTDVTAPKLAKQGTLSFKVFENSEAPDDISLAQSLQYSAASGEPLLLQFMKDHVAQTHDIGFKDWDTTLSIGNTYAWDLVLRTFCETTDTILFEQYSFSTALECAQNRGCNCVGVGLDDDGIIPSDLRLVAERHRPKLLYCVPTGQNPTGCVWSAERRREVVEIANEYDFIIIEDEPYYYLQMEGHELAPSLLEFDTEGRVIRLDSFSKIMAPGVRLSWITGQERLVRALREFAEPSSSKPSGFTQSLIYGVLSRWGHSGFSEWLHSLRKEYLERRDLCCSVLQRDLEGVAELKTPAAGMFFWLKVPIPERLRAMSAYDVEHDLFRILAEDYGILLVPGHWFLVEESHEDDKNVYLRGTFANTEKTELAEAAERLSTGIKDFLLGKPREPYVVVE